MINVKMSFDTGENIAKLPAGPTRPRPGPMFDRHDMTAVKFVVMS